MMTMKKGLTAPICCDINKFRPNGGFVRVYRTYVLLLCGRSREIHSSFFRSLNLGVWCVRFCWMFFFAMSHWAYANKWARVCVCVYARPLLDFLRSGIVHIISLIRFVSISNMHTPKSMFQIFLNQSFLCIISNFFWTHYTKSFFLFCFREFRRKVKVENADKIKWHICICTRTHARICHFQFTTVKTLTKINSPHCFWIDK